MRIKVIGSAHMVRGQVGEDLIIQMIKLMNEFLHGTEKGGGNEYNIRLKDVKIEGLDELVEIDVTSETKKLEVDYSSDICVRDRLESIRKQYGEERKHKKCEVDRIPRGSGRGEWIESVWGNVV